jgi:ADP-ribose pyrophosphatase YjhB (NUDIX family)
MRTKPLVPHDEYMKSLPRKIIGAGALFTNEKEEILLVKPNYKDTWQLPGGSVDLNESPRDACVREVKEEIGLTLEHPELLCVRYKPATDGWDGLLFVFDGGVLDANEIQKIVLQEEELDAYKFVPLEEASQLVSKGTFAALTAAKQALKNKSIIYIETI